MKSFADNSFFLLFDEILSRDKPKESPGRWAAGGVTWQYGRHGYESADYGFAVETYEVTSAAKGWTLLVVKEHWWAGRNGETIRSARWAKPLRGNRTAIIAWLRSRQRDMEGKS
ncbi:MAG: hypothetical protein ACREHV_07165 [Rhizomicrobium sp.]